MFDTLYSQIGGVVMVAVIFFALWKGDEPERSGAIAYTVAWVAAMLLQSGGGYYAIQPAIFAIDVVVFGVFIWLSYTAKRAWTVWATAFQLIAVLGHIVLWLDMRPPANTYWTVLALASYGVLVALAIGTFWAWQERRAAGLE